MPDPTAPDVRESLRSLPGQLILTFITGKPYAGQAEVRLTPDLHLLGAVGSLLAGLGASTAALLVAGRAGPLVLLAGWAMTLHGLRNLRIVIFHHCAHGDMWGRPTLDRATGTVLAGLLVVQNLDTYSTEHLRDHHSRHHMTMRDPTVRTLVVTLGLRPGMTPSQMWRRVGRRLCSPWFHLRFMLARIGAYVSSATWPQRASFVLAYGVLAVVLTRVGGWTVFIAVWLVPLTVLFQVANTLRICARHTFPAPTAGHPGGRTHVGQLTSAVFVGEARPAGPLRWLRWTVRMLLVHLPARYLVLTGDTVCHDYHHRHPNADDWADYIFTRQRDLAQGHVGWPAYQEVWGLAPAITAVFRSLSTADPRVYDAATLAPADRLRFTMFDD